jgi:hypothetical protein
MIDVIREVGELRESMCGGCGEKVDGLLARWNAQPEEALQSVSENYIKMIQALFTSHEWRQKNYESRFTPDQMVQWRKWVKDLYERTCLEGEEANAQK